MPTPENNPADIELIESYLKGSECAFETLYNRYRKRLYAYLNRLFAPETACVDDLFQQVWLRVIPNLEKYDDREKFISWLFRIAHNLSIDYFRSRRRENLSSLLENDTLPEESQDFRFNDDPDIAQTCLPEAIARLPAEQREVVLLRQEGVAFKTIADIQAVPLNTAIGRMHDALRRLKHILSNTIPSGGFYEK